MAERVAIVTLPAPLPHQVPMLRSKARLKLDVSARRVGKTTRNKIAALDGHGAGKGALHGATIWCVFPTWTMGEEMWRALCTAADAVAIDKSESTRTLRFPGGGLVSVRSGDNPDALRGV